MFFFKARIHGITVLSEVAFMQNYGYPFRIHTWSIAAEEHFYFFLSLFIFIMLKWKQVENKKAVIIFLTGMIVFITMNRFIHCYRLIGRQEAFFATHLRGDGLFMGALLSYLWHVKQKSGRYQDCSQSIE